MARVSAIVSIVAVTALPVTEASADFATEFRFGKGLEISFFLDRCGFPDEGTRWRKALLRVAADCRVDEDRLSSWRKMLPGMEDQARAEPCPSERGVSSRRWAEHWAERLRAAGDDDEAIVAAGNSDESGRPGKVCGPAQ